MAMPIVLQSTLRPTLRLPGSPAGCICQARAVLGHVIAYMRTYVHVHNYTLGPSAYTSCKLQVTSCANDWAPLKINRYGNLEKRILYGVRNHRESCCMRATLAALRTTASTGRASQPPPASRRKSFHALAGKVQRDS